MKRGTILGFALGVFVAVAACRGGEDKVQALIGLLASDDAAEREKAARGLAKIGAAAKVAVPALLKAIRDKKSGVSNAAAQALINIRPKPEAVVQALAEALEDESLFTRLNAAQVLMKMGPAAKSAAPALLKALGSTGIPRTTRMPTPWPASAPRPCRTSSRP